MLDYFDYKKLDAIAAAEGIRKKDFTSAELTEASISRSIEINPSINAIVIENFEHALVQARELDEHPALFEKSRVAGLPFLIKDLTEVKGWGRVMAAAFLRIISRTSIPTSLQSMLKLACP